MSLTLKEVSVLYAMTKILGSKRYDAMKCSKIEMSYSVHDNLSSSRDNNSFYDQVNKGKMGGICSTHGEVISAYGT
jgi:hypothetical protein